MRDWLSAADLAALGLPGLPATKRGWNDYAEREDWLERRDEHGAPLARTVTGAGGTRVEYHIDLLPQISLASYVAGHIGKVDMGRAEAVAASLGQQPATIAALEQRDARLALIKAADDLARTTGLSRHTADKLFAGLYRMEKIDVAPWVRNAVDNFSARTLERWRTHRARGDLNRLGVDKGAARRGKGKLESGEGGKVKAFLLAEIGRNKFTSCRKLRDLVAHEFPTLADVSQDTVERMVKKLREEHKVALTALMAPDQFRGRYRVAGEKTDAKVYRLNQLWEIDASPADVLLLEGRYSIYACVDVFSRRMIILVTKTPRAEAVGLLIRKAIAEWGVPEIIKTDNGSDFRAKFTQHLFNALEIEIDVCPPYQPQKKPHVERGIQTFQHDFCSDLPGFVGHDVADRKLIEERRSFAKRLGSDDNAVFKVELTAAQLQSRADDWARNDYGTRAHSGIGVSPFERAAAFPGVARRLDDPAALNVLLAPIAKGDGTRMVTKRGVKVDGRHYHTYEMPETKVFVRMDPQDMGRIWLFSEDGLDFLGEAICPEVAGVDPAAAVAEMRAYQKRAIEEVLAPIRKELRKRSQLDIADIHARAAAERAGKLVAFPRREESYTTPGIAAAGEAARMSGEPSPEQVRETIRAIDTFVDSQRASVESDLVGAQAAGSDKVQPLRKASTPQQRIALARSIDRRLYAGEEVSEAEAVWLGGYRRDPEFIALMSDGGERFRHAQLLTRIKSTGEPLWPHEEAWLNGYVGGSEYAAMNEIFKDFGEGGLR